jgi:uncharacterized protein (DUF486 family)
MVDPGNGVASVSDSIIVAAALAILIAVSWGIAFWAYRAHNDR